MDNWYRWCRSSGSDRRSFDINGQDGNRKRYCSTYIDTGGGACASFCFFMFEIGAPGRVIAGVKEGSSWKRDVVGEVVADPDNEGEKFTVGVVVVVRVGVIYCVCCGRIIP